MAGHSPWANIKHRKAAVDAKRGKLWSKLSKAIIVAAKMGGGDPDSNLRLRYAINDAKAVSMPKDNIERAVKKGTGELEGGEIEEILYEGYGPGGVAILCEIVTDNRHRTAPEVRKIFDKHGGKLGGTGCVAWMFERKSVFIVSAAKIDEEKLMEIVLEAGADDLARQGDAFQVTAPADAFAALSDALTAGGIEPESKQLARIPTSTVEVADVETARTVLDLVNELDDHDDVQSVSANFNIPDEALAAIGT
ncbi:MAG TPA: YebC/PmpR family DNA-binding transcriptional regulator [Pirellulaceae bacterium]|nr:YebC/PmpR family DNA-binding transcriptional regulator [Pirellulaceae bacterium]